ncbi:MAG: Ig-like domain-containing protein, partial [Saprospiraceae bacterium]|nr:Ig-like domain-containing protein [Saprospiraceae bacterium]
MPVRTNSLHALLILVVFASCARQGAPAGGPKDTRPPEVDTLRSSRNYATRFEGRKIELKFDEWVVLSDVVTQIVVSPPLAERPEVTLNGRTVVLKFDKNEVLRQNTTYTINFGASVKDLHEGNPAKDLRFVFSTGDFIDSLGFKGQITDAFTGEPVENVAVLLHENQADTAVRKERPYYFTRTDKTGQYSFQNLRAGVFQLVAVEDIDLNLKWDGENEKITFLDQPVTVSDSLRIPLNLKLFKNQSKFRLTSQQANNYGLAKLVFNGAADSVQLQWQAPPDADILLERAPDSLNIWYNLPVDTAWSMVVTHPAWTRLDTTSGQLISYADTIQLKKRSRSEFMEKHRLGFGDVALKPAPAPARGKSLGAPAAKPAPPVTKTILQLHNRPATLPFNYPVQAFDTALWQLKIDTVPVKNYTIGRDSLHPT